MRAKRSEAKRARKRALSHVVVDEFHLQNLKTAITQKLSILEVWCIEQNVFSCTCFTHIWHNFCHSEQKNRPGPTRPLSRFWDAYCSETINFRENNYRTKNVYPNHKFFVLKFGNDPMNDVLGRPYFVRVTFFPFFGYIFWSNKNFECLKTAFERASENLSDSIYIFAIFFLWMAEKLKFHEKMAFFTNFFQNFRL